LPFSWSRNARNRKKLNNNTRPAQKKSEAYASLRFGARLALVTSDLQFWPSAELVYTGGNKQPLKQGFGPRAWTRTWTKSSDKDLFSRFEIMV
jgi:hypothetical protein